MPVEHIKQTPVELYAKTGITADTEVQVQNKSGATLLIFAGDSAPTTQDEYFELAGKSIGKFKGDTLTAVARSGQISVLVVATAAGITNLG